MYDILFSVWQIERDLKAMALLQHITFTDINEWSKLVPICDCEDSTNTLL